MIRLSSFVLLPFVTFSIASSFAQDEPNEACFEPDKKTMKVLGQAESEKYTRMERLQFYTTAVEMAPGNSWVYFSFAQFNFSHAETVQDAYDNGRANFVQLKQAYEGAAKTYKEVIFYCPEFNADAYYKLGFIYYLLNEKGEAAKYFKAFLAFKSDDVSRYGEQYAEHKREVEEILPEMEFYDKFYNNLVQFNPVPVTNVSSKKDEYLPMVSPDNELIFYTRKGDDGSRGVTSVVIEEFTVSLRPDIDGDFDGGEAMRAPFNTTKYMNYGGVTLSLDNKEMFICACEKVNYQEHADCDIYVTHFERSGEGGNDFVWSPLQDLGTAINTPDGWEAQPTLSADGNTLYFATWREGSMLTDIYYSTRGADGKWTQAKPVPGDINTEGHDKAPFLHQDSETLYFVSDCSTERMGAGGSDIFYTRKDESGNWATPTNIGFPINSAANEVGLVVSYDGHLAYYTFRNVNTDSYDIFYFELYEEARPKSVKIYKGVVKDQQGEPVKDAIVEVSYKESGESTQVKVNGDDGKFTAVVMADEETDVMITMKKEGFSFDTELIKAEEVVSTEETTIKGIEMEIDEIEVGKAFTIDDILFDTDSYVLSGDSKFILDQFVKFLNENPGVKVTIQGHTDDQGDNERNKTLSQNRAKAVMDYIVSKGVSADRLKSEGYGETKPKVPNTSAENRAQNRRTDFLITAM
jgi:outer membrane protein OmpA-like peptidoglycan-associated protein/tetratricopeptide (TPR) repeat protein